MIGSMLFTWIQEADFYQELHREAVETVPYGAGKLWLDVGCGPGLVSRLAADRGYNVTGIDIDLKMIKSAQRMAKDQNSAAKFEVGSLFSLSENMADVVSAASLLAVLENKSKGLRALWDSVRPGGYLLIIEPTEKMNPFNAKHVINSRFSGRAPSKRIQGLKLWAMARQNRAVNPWIFQTVDSGSLRYFELLDGLVGAWLLGK